MEFYHEKSNGTPEQWWLLLGPSLQWRPTSWMHIDLAPLIGCTHDSPKMEAYLIFGIDFGSGVKKNEHYVPASVHAQ